MLVDNTHAIMTIVEFKKLPEYSMSLPTGTFIGKRWKRLKRGKWLMGEYIEFDPPNPKEVKIIWREILEVI